MKVKLTIDGVQNIMKSIDKYGPELKKVLGPAVKAGADLIKADAKNRIHHISGELAESITSEVTWAKSNTAAYAGCFIDADPVYTKSGQRYFVANAVEYGHYGPGSGGFTALKVDAEGNFVTYKRGKKKGRIKVASKKTKTVKPHPFMRPALKAKKTEVINAIESRVKQVFVVDRN